MLTAFWMNIVLLDMEWLSCGITVFIILHYHDCFLFNASRSMLILLTPLHNTSSMSMKLSVKLCWHVHHDCTQWRWFPWIILVYTSFSYMDVAPAATLKDLWTVTFLSTGDFPRSSKPRPKPLSGPGSWIYGIDTLVEVGNPSSLRSSESGDSTQ